MARKSTKEKPAKVQPFCACGCGQRTGGGTFRPGHDQRLRGILKRGETLKQHAKAFVGEQAKSSEWMRLKLKASRGSARKSAPARSKQVPQKLEAPAASVKRDVA